MESSLKVLNFYVSRLYFGEHNIPGMFATLEPLHQKMENGPETLKEISFNHVRLLYIVCVCLCMCVRVRVHVHVCVCVFVCMCAHTYE